MTHKIRITETTLTDGSAVYDVLFDGIVLPCVTEHDAVELMTKIIVAVGEHTNETIVCTGLMTA
jgi:UDP-glucose 6-dehydrogenase